VTSSVADWLPFLFRTRGEFVEREVQFQNVDTRFAEKSEFALLCMFLNQIANRGFGQASLFRDAGNLKLRGSGRNFRIQTGGGRRDEIYGNEL